MSPTAHIASWPPRFGNYVQQKQFSILYSIFWSVAIVYTNSPHDPRGDFSSIPKRLRTTTVPPPFSPDWTWQYRFGYVWCHVFLAHGIRYCITFLRITASRRASLWWRISVWYSEVSSYNTTAYQRQLGRSLCSRQRHQLHPFTPPVKENSLGKSWPCKS